MTPENQNLRNIGLTEASPRNIVYIGFCETSTDKAQHLADLKRTNPEDGKKISWHTAEDIPQGQMNCNSGVTFCNVSAKLPRREQNGDQP